MRTSVDVHNFLTERDIPHEVFPTPGRLRSAELVAAVLDLPPDEVGKVLVYGSPKGPLAVVIPAGREPDEEALRRAIAVSRIDPLTEDRASALTGYLFESIPPVGLPDGFTVVMDVLLDRDAVLYFAGGEVRSVLKIRGTDLIRATGATVAAIATPVGAQVTR